MYNKIFFASLLLSLSMFSSAQIFAANSCRIESGPIPLLARYSHDIDTQIAALVVSGRATGVCGITKNGASVSVERTSDIISSATTGFAYFPNLLLDFSYNIGVAINGETRAAVKEQGQIFALVDQRITRAIENVSNQCQLSDEVKSGFVSLLRENNTLSNVYKQAALGTPSTDFAGLSSSGQALAQAINDPVL